MPNLTNGILGATYNYDHNGESFIIDFQIAQVVDDSVQSNEGGNTDSDVPTPAPTPTPEPAVAAPRFTMNELRDIYLTFQDLSIDEKISLTYEDVLPCFFNGVEGNITNQGDTFVSYQWISIESETSLLNMTFKEDDNGELTYSSMSINNIDYE